MLVKIVSPSLSRKTCISLSNSGAFQKLGKSKIQIVSGKIIFTIHGHGTSPGKSKMLCMKPPFYHPKPETKPSLC
jgi:hypothetical protein